MNRELCISSKLWEKRVFNAHAKEDLIEFGHFLTHTTWKTNCPFVLQDPYTNVPDMIRSQIIAAHISNLINN